MALFQQSVLKKHIETLNNAVISQKWEKFQAHFLNATIQQNIRKSKEEQYQEGFLRDLFVNIFGYILNPTEHFNLTTELKNITNSKKVDGAIVIDGKAIGVIELKGTDTTDLAKIEAQAFGYKTNQPGCNYVITSNFEKLRFYIDNTTQFEEFNLFTLSKEQFTTLYCCLDWDSISTNVPTNLLNQSVSKENAITKQLYNEYSTFKRSLYNNLVALNPQHDKLELFKKTQKLLDRFLFIFFAEDRLLLPTNLIRRINKEWENLQKMRIPVSLYDRYVIYFHDLNEGAKVTLPAFGKKTGEAIEETHEIFAYNGGLFKVDAFLDNLKIDDQLLYEHTHKLSDYDFQSEVDVNILGHIFENSLNEIDEIKSEIEGKEIDKTKTKRKKDGVFYTPKYITKYIVDNTVGKLCSEKKEELKLIEEEYHTDKNLQTKTKKALLDKLNDYREWLLQLTICDPACGSGAFLNQALEFLIAEHRYVDELQAKLMGDALILSDVETSILEKNLYGVDLNDESIEIAKLSLWLRTAQKGRKLNSLNNNIKCGNSLIDDPEIAGEKAFSWEKEFPDVFAPSTGSGGGFDVIIGNPPYVRSRGLFEENEKQYFTKKFSTSSYQLDLYKLFIEKSCKLINQSGCLSFITPSVFLINEYDKPLRKFLLDNYNLSIIANTDENIFDDASVKTVVFVINRAHNINSSINFYKIFKSDFIFEKQVLQDLYIKQDYLINEKINSSSIKIISKLNKNKFLDNYYEVKNGIKVRKELLYDQANDDDFKPFILGKNIFPYYNSSDGIFIDYKIENEKLYSNQAFRNKEIFEQEKLIVRQILGKRIVTTFDDSNVYTDQTTYVINLKKSNYSLKYLMLILNSKLMYYYFTNTSSDNKIVFPKVKKSQLLELPIVNLKNQEIFLNRANFMLSANKDFQQITQKFTTYFSSQYSIEKLSGKLEKWYELTFVDFIKELNKAIKAVKGTPLTKKVEFEWMDLFEENKKKALEIKAEIDKTDKEIDQMVYELYGLTEEEIKIICDATS